MQFQWWTEKCFENYASFKIGNWDTILQFLCWKRCQAHSVRWAGTDGCSKIGAFQLSIVQEGEWRRIYEYRRTSLQCWNCRLMVQFFLLFRIYYISQNFRRVFLKTRSLKSARSITQTIFNIFNRVFFYIFIITFQRETRGVFLINQFEQLL